MKKIYISPVIDVYDGVVESLITASANDIMTKANNDKNGGSVFSEQQTPGINYGINPSTDQYYKPNSDEWLNTGDLD